MPPVIVIGAGPGGCSAALTLAARGVETVLLERKTLPRPKTCAGGLSPWTLTWLEEHGLRAQVEAEALPIGGARVWTDPALEPIALRGRLQAAVLPRARFDSMLVEAVRAAGVVVREGVTARSLVREGTHLVGVDTDAGNLEAQAVVVASGATGRLAPAERTDRFFGIMTRYRGLRDVDDAVEFFLDGAMGLQYGWIFPEGGDVANVGLCYQRRPHRPNARVLFDQFLERHLSRRLEGAEPLGRVQAHPIRAHAWPRRLVEEATLYVGEAAGLVDPLTGEGIYYGLRSGELAGRVLATHLQHRRALTAIALGAYTAAVSVRIAPRLAASAGALAVLGSPLLAPLGSLLSSAVLRRLVHTFYPHL